MSSEWLNVSVKVKAETLKALVFNNLNYYIRRQTRQNNVIVLRLSNTIDSNFTIDNIDYSEILQTVSIFKTYISIRKGLTIKSITVFKVNITESEYEFMKLRFL